VKGAEAELTRNLLKKARGKRSSSERFRYDWVVRTRFDLSYLWPLPPLLPPLLLSPPLLSPPLPPLLPPLQTSADVGSAAAASAATPTSSSSADASAADASADDADASSADADSSAADASVDAADASADASAADASAADADASDADAPDADADADSSTDEVVSAGAAFSTAPAAAVYSLPVVGYYDASSVHVPYTSLPISDVFAIAPRHLVRAR